MKRRLLILGVVLFAILTVLAVLGRSMGSGIRSRFPSSLAGEAEGTLAFRRLLQELGREVRLLDAGWDGDGIQGNGLLIVTTPLQRGVRSEEIPALEDWIRSGGSLLVVEDATFTERSPALTRFLEEAGLDGVVPITDINPATMKPYRPGREPSRGGAGVPRSLKIRRVQLNEDGGIDPGEEAAILTESDRGRVTSAAVPLGEGTVALVIGPLLANDRILDGDALNLALWLVDSLAAGGPVWFDEFHHGHGGILANLGSLHRSALVWAALQALLAAVLYAFTRGVRFGPVRPTPEPPRRSALEFVHSMASMYRRAEAGRHALETMLMRIRRDARYLLGGRDRPSAAALGAALSARYDLDEGTTIATLTQAEQAAGGSRLSRGELMTRARELARLQQEIIGEHRTSH